MKAVILAAGKGTRMLPLTFNTPKPLLRAAGKSLLAHNIEQLMDIVDEVIIVIGFKAEKIKKEIGNKHGRIKITYVAQKKQAGTGHALLQVSKFISGRFIVMNGDDLYFRGDIRKLLNYDQSVLAKRVQNYSEFGVFIKKGKKLLDLVEKPKTFVSDLANAGCYLFSKSIFSALKNIKKTSRNEIELTSALKQIAKKQDVFCVEAKAWLPIGYPWNLLEADQIMRDIDVKKGKNTVLKGKVTNCTIGSNCKIDGFVKNSILGDNVIVHKDSVIIDSIIGNKVNFAGTVMTANKVRVSVQNKQIETENFGAVIGDGAHLQNVLVSPGTMVWPMIKKKNAELKENVK